MLKTVTIENINCEHCVKTVEREVGEIEGVQNVKADQASKRVDIEWDDPATWDDIKDLLIEIEYPPSE